MLHVLFELFKDNRTPFQKRRDQVITTLVLVVYGVVLGAGVYTGYGWISNSIHLW
jgi:hypothetical protein